KFVFVRAASDYDAACGKGGSLVPRLSLAFAVLFVLAALGARPDTTYAETEASDLLNSKPWLRSADAGASASSGARPARWALNANLGAGIVKDELSSLLTTPISGELNLLRIQGRWRFGAGISFGSFSMRPPYVHGLEFGFQQTYLSATRMLT